MRTLASGTSTSTTQNITFTVGLPGPVRNGPRGARAPDHDNTTLPTGVSDIGEIEDFVDHRLLDNHTIARHAGQPGGRLGLPQTVSASGGTAPYTYSLASGSLPTGLSLNASTGTITGTPSGTGTSTFTISATDAAGCTGTSGTFTLTTTAITSDSGDFSGFGAATQAADTNIRIGTAATDAESTTPANATATGDDTTGTDFFS